MEQQRQQYRIPIKRTGHLTAHGQRSECHVSDLTEQGFQLRTELPLVVGDMLHLACQLDAHSMVDCEIQVTHARPPVFGSRIAEISPEQQERLSRFIQHVITLTMMGL